MFGLSKGGKSAGRQKRTRLSSQLKSAQKVGLALVALACLVLSLVGSVGVAVFVVVAFGFRLYPSVLNRQVSDGVRQKDINEADSASGRLFRFQSRVTRRRFASMLMFRGALSAEGWSRPFQGFRETYHFVGFGLAGEAHVEQATWSNRWRVTSLVSLLMALVLAGSVVVPVVGTPLTSLWIVWFVGLLNVVLGFWAFQGVWAARRCMLEPDHFSYKQEYSDGELLAQVTRMPSDPGDWGVVRSLFAPGAILNFAVLSLMTVGVAGWLLWLFGLSVCLPASALVCVWLFLFANEYRQVAAADWLEFQAANSALTEWFDAFGLAGMQLIEEPSFECDGLLKQWSVFNPFTVPPAEVLETVPEVAKKERPDSGGGDATAIFGVGPDGVRDNVFLMVTPTEDLSGYSVWDPAWSDSASRSDAQLLQHLVKARVASALADAGKSKGGWLNINQVLPLTKADSGTTEKVNPAKSMAYVAAFFDVYGSSDEEGFVRALATVLRDKSVAPLVCVVNTVDTLGEAYSSFGRWTVLLGRDDKWISARDKTTNWRNRPSSSLTARKILVADRLNKAGVRGAKLRNLRMFSGEDSHGRSFESVEVVGVPFNDVFNATSKLREQFATNSLWVYGGDGNVDPNKSLVVWGDGGMDLVGDAKLKETMSDLHWRQVYLVVFSNKLWEAKVSGVNVRQIREVADDGGEGVPYLEARVEFAAQHFFGDLVSNRQRIAERLRDWLGPVDVKITRQRVGDGGGDSAATDIVRSADDYAAIVFGELPPVLPVKGEGGIAADNSSRWAEVLKQAYWDEVFQAVGLADAGTTPVFCGEEELALGVRRVHLAKYGTITRDDIEKRIDRMCTAGRIGFLELDEFSDRDRFAMLYAEKDPLDHNFSFDEYGVPLLHEAKLGHPDVVVPYGVKADGTVATHNPLQGSPGVSLGAAAGSGKSVLLRNFFISLLHNNTPDDLIFLLVEPKNGLEAFAQYEHVKAMIMPNTVGFERHAVVDEETGMVTKANPVQLGGADIIRFLRMEIDRRSIVLQKYNQPNLGAGRREEQRLRERAEKLRAAGNDEAAAEALAGAEELAMPYILVVIEEAPQVLSQTKNKEERPLRDELRQKAEQIPELGRASGCWLFVVGQDFKDTKIPNGVTKNTKSIGLRTNTAQASMNIRGDNLLSTLGKFQGFADDPDTGDADRFKPFYAADSGDVLAAFGSGGVEAVEARGLGHLLEFDEFGDPQPKSSVDVYLKDVPKRQKTLNGWDEEAWASLIEPVLGAAAFYDPNGDVPRGPSQDSVDDFEWGVESDSDDGGAPDFEW